jgi:hypothetical protein
MNIYITFSEEATAALKAGFNSELEFESEIWTVKDSFFVGPLQFIQEDMGREHRLTYHNETLKYFGLTEIGADDALHNYKLLQNVIAHLEIEAEDEKEENTITLWMGQNANDVCGYFWLTQQLQNYCGKVNVIYLNNLPFFNEKGGLFYPTHLHQIPAIEFIKCLKVERKIAIHEFEVEKDEWKALYENEDTYRILDGAKKITCKNEDLFDVTIKMTLMGESVKLGKLVNMLLAKLPNFPSEIFLLSRVKALIEQGVLVQKKGSKNWREIEIAKT